MHDLDLGDIVQPSRDAGIVYELRPNARGRFVGQPLLINSQGLHDYEYQPSAKSPAHFGSLESATRRCSGGACHSRIAA